MDSTLILIVVMVAVLVALYYALIGIVTLLKQLVDHARGALKSVFIVAGVVIIVWIICHYEDSAAILSHIQLWISDVRRVDLFDLNLES